MMLFWMSPRWVDEKIDDALCSHTGSTKMNTQSPFRRDRTRWFAVIHGFFIRNFGCQSDGSSAVRCPFRMSLHATFTTDRLGVVCHEKVSQSTGRAFEILFCSLTTSSIWSNKASLGAIRSTVGRQFLKTGWGKNSEEPKTTVMNRLSAPGIT